MQGLSKVRTLDLPILSLIHLSSIIVFVTFIVLSKYFQVFLGESIQIEEGVGFCVCSHDCLVVRW